MTAFLVRLVNDLLAFVSSESTSYECGQDANEWSCHESSEIPDVSKPPKLVIDNKVLPSFEGNSELNFMINGKKQKLSDLRSRPETEELISLVENGTDDEKGMAAGKLQVLAQKSHGNRVEIVKKDGVKQLVRFIDSRVRHSMQETTEIDHECLYVGMDKEIKTTKRLPPLNKEEFVRIVCVSDTHTQEERIFLPPGDLLIHAGDALYKNMDADNATSIRQVSTWLREQPCRKAFLIGGNHDKILEDMGPVECKNQFGGYIEDEEVQFEGFRIWGTPLSRPYKHGGEIEEGDQLGGNKAFQQNTFARIAKIPEEDIDILVTHGAPKGMLDVVWSGHVGCPVLMRKVQTLKPRVHIFGHVHCQGEKRVQVDHGVTYVNACNFGEFVLEPDCTMYPPIVIDIARVQVSTNATKAVLALQAILNQDNQKAFDDFIKWDGLKALRKLATTGNPSEKGVVKKTLHEIFRRNDQLDAELEELGLVSFS